jgi:nicotinamidase-related amidase
MPYQVSDINPAKCALIVVDMQNDFVAPGAPMETPAGERCFRSSRAQSTFVAGWEQK